MKKAGLYLLIFVILSINISLISAEKYTLKVTGEHPFYVLDDNSDDLINVMQVGNVKAGESGIEDNTNGIWKTAKELKVGDELLTSNGKKAKITSIKEVNENVDVYNLHVDGVNDYFAGNVLVHNKAWEVCNDIEILNEYLRLRSENPNLRLGDSDFKYYVTESNFRFCECFYSIWEGNIKTGKRRLLLLVGEFKFFFDENHLFILDLARREWNIITFRKTKEGKRISASKSKYLGEGPGLPKISVNKEEGFLRFWDDDFMYDFVEGIIITEVNGVPVEELSHESSYILVYIPGAERIKLFSKSSYVADYSPNKRSTLTTSTGLRLEVNENGKIITDLPNYEYRGIGGGTREIALYMIEGEMCESLKDNLRKQLSKESLHGLDEIDIDCLESELGRYEFAVYYNGKPWGLYNPRPGEIYILRPGAIVCSTYRISFVRSLKSIKLVDRTGREWILNYDYNILFPVDKSSTLPFYDNH